MFDVPTLMVGAKDTDKDKENLRSYGMVEKPGRPHVFIGTPSAAHLPLVLKHSIDIRHEPGFVPTNGYVCYIIALKALQLYTSVSRHQKIGGKPNYFMAWTDACGPTASGGPKVYSAGGNDYVTVAGVVGSGEYMCHDEVTAYVAPYDKSKAIVGSFVNSQGVGLPLTDGAFFPFFEGMLQPDQSLFLHVFERIFYHSLGDSNAEASRLWARVKDGIKSLSYLPAGRMLSHAFLGVKIAEQAGAGLMLAYEGTRYFGFTLSCSNLVIKSYGREYSSVPVTEVQADLASLTFHDRAIAAIVRIVNAVTAQDGTSPYKWKAETITSSTVLRRMLLTLDLGIVTDISGLKRAINDTRFSDQSSYPLPNPQNLLDFIHYVQDGDFTHLAKYPQYMAAGKELCTSRLEVGLCIYGARAPTLNYAKRGAGNQEFVLPLDLSKEDPNTVGTKESPRRLKYLPFAIEPLNLAISQWKRLFEDGRFALPGPRKGNKTEFVNNQSVQSKITNDPAFSEFYETMKKISSEQRKLRKEGKRGREDESERPNIKKAKKAQDDDADLL
jgi:hypothetical protein